MQSSALSCAVAVFESSKYVPAGQSLHCWLALVFVNFPGAHVRHELSESEPLCALYLPGEQGRHTFSVICASPALEYLPVPQVLQTLLEICVSPASEYLPGPQALQTMLEFCASPASEYLPGPQALQTLLEICASPASEYRPGSHALQTLLEF